MTKPLVRLLLSSLLVLACLSPPSSALRAEEAAASEEAVLTPERAVQLMLAEPLTFIDRFDAREIGLFSQICLWRNSHVFVRLNYCSVGPGTERRGDEVTGFRILTRDGGEVRLYAENYSSTSIFESPLDEISSLRLSYHEWSKHFPELDIDTLDAASYAVFADASQKVSFGEAPQCWSDSGGKGFGYECRNLPDEALQAWTKGVDAFAGSEEGWVTLRKHLEDLRSKGIELDKNPDD